MSKLSDFSQGVLSAVIIIYIVIFLYAFYHDKNKEAVIRTSTESSERYQKFSEELSDDMRKYNIGRVDKQSIENVVHGILEKKTAEKSLFWRLINSGKSGFLIGGLSGAITTGPAGALATGVVFGLVNPIVIVMNEFSTVTEELTASQEAKERKKLRHV
jgi:predicted PurR-regulated permease PerM